MPASALRPAALLRDLRRAVGWHRRLLAAGLAAAAVAFGLQAVSPDPPPATPVVVAARDLPAGTALGAGDLAVRLLPPSAVPTGSVGSRPPLLGRVLASAARAGEPLTDVRVVGRALLRALPAGVVAAPVRIADGVVLALLRSGDLVDVVAARPAGPGAGEAAGDVVAGGARVLTVLAPASDDPEGGVVVVGVPPATAVDLARAAVSARLSVLLRPG